MRGRNALLIAGGGLVLVLLLVLKSLLSVDTPAEPMASVRTQEPAPSLRDQAPPPPTTGTPATRSARIPPRDVVTRPTSPGSAIEPPDVAVDPITTTTATADDVPRSNMPIADKARLREAMNAVEPQVRECVERLGANVSGVVAATWTVISRNGQSLVETSGVEYDETTVDQPELLECLHKTAMAMTFEPNPGAMPVFARRKITIENGRLANQAFISFSRIY